jgi:hypothetical protein
MPGIPDMSGPLVWERLLWQPETAAPARTRPARPSKDFFPIAVSFRTRIRFHGIAADAWLAVPPALGPPSGMD